MFVITNSRVFVVLSQKGDGVLDKTTQAKVLLDDDVCSIVSISVHSMAHINKTYR
jgi:hypothetical protein